MEYNTQSKVILQAFNWHSWRSHNKTFYNHLKSKSNDIKNSGIDAIWLPPSSKSVSPQGYMPLNYYDLDSEYGTKNELITCIHDFKEKDIDVYADIVINHRCAEFQNENGIYNVFGGKLCWKDTAIVSNHTKFEGKGNHKNFKLFNSAPNIDHSQPYVKKDLTEWMLWLKNDIGFSGFRFDFMTGIDPQHMKEYFVNINTNVCIGEFWDNMDYDNEYLVYNQDQNRQRIINWIDLSGKHAYAFDMTTKGVLQEALKNHQYWRLSDQNNQPPGLIGWWNEKSVTFLDNHDTHVSSQNLWPFPDQHVIDGYVYILMHPGTPMIFWDHLNCDRFKDTVITLIKIRKEYNIHATSIVEIVSANDLQYSAIIDKKIKITIGQIDQIDNYLTLFRSNNSLIQFIS